MVHPRMSRRASSQFQDIRNIFAFRQSLNQSAPFGDAGCDSSFGDGDSWDNCGVGENLADDVVHPYE
eukprot:CAMPEP_0180160342 /NCGR_PEP_ID=MMETSP0986-20121125/28046_1 /TAXON_ID=697907 /ORGANISM="non described non described, Strain CCMP2293" /LENGTH=66 /DNA_ID=CAMNT_0022110567 /DNA_START=81 /DNA_END=281 /DNA_ORIENTATION=-